MKKGGNIGAEKHHDLVVTLLVSSIINLLTGVGCCVAGILKWDHRTPLAFKHGGGENIAFERTTYRSDISLIFALAAINLLSTTWPFACIISRWFNIGKTWDVYIKNVMKNNVNPFRWLEFSLSVPLTVMICALELGANDFLFLLSQMTLAVAIVILTYGQEREKMVNRFPEKEIRVPWMPVASAIGLFFCQWALIFWCAYEARAFGTKTNHVGWAPTSIYLLGAALTLYTIARSSRYFVILLKGDLTSMFSNKNAEIIEQSISCVTRVLITGCSIPILRNLK